VQPRPRSLLDVTDPAGAVATAPAASSSQCGSPKSRPRSSRWTDRARVTGSLALPASASSNPRCSAAPLTRCRLARTHRASPAGWVFPGWFMPLTLRWSIPWHRPPENQLRTASLEDPDRCDQRRPACAFLDHERRTPAGKSRLREAYRRDVQKRLVPYTKSREDPRPPRSAQGFGLSAKRWHTLSRRLVRGTPSKEPSIRRRQATLTHGPPSPPNHRSLPRNRPRRVGALGPQGPSSPWRVRLLLLAMRHRGCVRSTPAIHISETSTSAPPGCGDRSPRSTPFTPRASLRPARTPLRPPVRQPGWASGRSSDVSVATRNERTTPAIRAT